MLRVCTENADAMNRIEKRLLLLSFDRDKGKLELSRLSVLHRPQSYLTDPASILLGDIEQNFNRLPKIDNAFKSLFCYLLVLFAILFAFLAIWVLSSQLK